jgi:hypothetical protein
MLWLKVVPSDGIGIPLICVLGQLMAARLNIYNITHIATGPMTEQKNIAENDYRLSLDQY